MGASALSNVANGVGRDGERHLCHDPILSNSILEPVRDPFYASNAFRRRLWTSEGLGFGGNSKSAWRVKVGCGI